MPTSSQGRGRLNGFRTVLLTGAQSEPQLQQPRTELNARNPLMFSMSVGMQKVIVCVSALTGVSTLKFIVRDHPRVDQSERREALALELRMQFLDVAHLQFRDADIVRHWWASAVSHIVPFRRLGRWREPRSLAWCSTMRSGPITGPRSGTRCWAHRLLGQHMVDAGTRHAHPPLGGHPRRPF